MHEITKEEIQEDIFAASPFKSADIDGILAGVGQKIWPIIKSNVTALFWASIAQGNYPRNGKLQKLSPSEIRKKATIPTQKHLGQFQFTILSKALESVIALRLSFLVENYRLLSDNHYGGRKRRFTLDVLMILQEEIFQAWRNKKILSLVTFNVKEHLMEWLSACSEAWPSPHHSTRQEGPRERQLKVQLPDLFNGKLHMECYHLCQ